LGCGRSGDHQRKGCQGGFHVFDLPNFGWFTYIAFKFPDNVNPAHAVSPFKGAGKACRIDG
jgi:hypothetical protein